MRAMSGGKSPRNGLDADAAAEAENAAAEGSPAGDSGFLPSGCVSGLPWFCYRTTWQGERLAEIELRRDGFCAWGPQLEVPWQNGQSRLREMFPRYGFVQFDPGEGRWPRIFSTRGVEWLFCTTARRPVRVPQAKLDELFRQCAPNGVIYLERPRRNRFRRGDPVVIQDSASPFDGWRGVCDMTARDRVIVLLSLFGDREVRVGVSREACRPVKATS